MKIFSYCTVDYCQTHDICGNVLDHSYAGILLDHLVLRPVTHAPETGSRNRRHHFDAGFRRFFSCRCTTFIAIPDRYPNAIDGATEVVRRNLASNLGHGADFRRV